MLQHQFTPPLEHQTIDIPAVIDDPMVFPKIYEGKVDLFLHANGCIQN
jgi:hypothetical protein